jgi:integrase
MRLLRAIFNFAAGEYEDAKGHSLVLENPVNRLSHTRAWYRVDRKQTIIKSHELQQWYEGLQQLTHRYDDGRAEMMQDFFMLIILTGLRRQEALSLPWSAIDFKAKTLTVTDTKNNQQHVLPLSDYLYDLLNRRKIYANSGYVFPSDSSTGYLYDPQKTLRKARKLTGIDFTLHDLRRTFITMAESLDIPVYALKRLLNHKMTTDVTAGYVVMDIERLRKPMQMITDYMLREMGTKTTGNVVSLKNKLTKGT